MGSSVAAPGAGVTSSITGTTTLKQDSAGAASFNYSGSVKIPANPEHGTYEREYPDNRVVFASLVSR